MTGAEGLDGHPCTAWCRDGQHVDLAYAHAAHWTPGEIRAAWERHGVTVTAVEPAREAPPDPRPEAGCPRDAWLVWWRPRP